MSTRNGIPHERIFGKHPDSDADTFIQWKGTEVCLDLNCPCGKHSHFDTDFAYEIRCPGCQRVYMLGTSVKAIAMPADYDDEYVKEALSDFDEVPDA